MSMVDNKQKMYAVFVIAILAFGILYLYWPQQGGQTGMKVGGTLLIDYGDGTVVTMKSDEAAKSDSLLDRLRGMAGLNVLTLNGRAFTANSKLTLSEFIVWDVKPNNADGSNRKANVQYWVNGYIEVTGRFANGLRSYDPWTGFHTTEISSFNGVKNTNYWNSMDLTGTSGFVPNYYAEKGSGLQIGNVNFGIPAVQMAHPLEEATKGIPLVGNAAQAATTVLGHVEVTNGGKETLFGYTKPVYETHIDLGRINWQGLSFNAGSFTVGAGTWTRLAVDDTYTITYKMNYIYRYQDVTGEWSQWKGGAATLFSITTQVKEGTYTTVNLNPGGGYSFFG